MGFKKDIMDYIQEKYPDLVPLYDAIYNKKDRSYFQMLEKKAKRLARNNNCPFVDNELPYGRAEQGHPVIVDYFYHEEVRGSENTGNGKRNFNIAGSIKILSGIIAFLVICLRESIS